MTLRDCCLNVLRKSQGLASQNIRESVMLWLAKIPSAPKMAQFFLTTARTASLHSTKNCFRKREGFLRRDPARACGVHIYKDGRRVRPD
jgi:hypothetical protein